MFHLISDHELRQLRGDLERAEEDLARERRENVRLHGWNRQLAAKVRGLEKFLAEGLPQQVAAHWAAARRTRETIAHLRGDVAQLELRLIGRPPIALPPAAADAAAGPAQVPVPDPAPAEAGGEQPVWEGEDTELIPVVPPAPEPVPEVVRLGSSAWATQKQIAELQQQAFAAS